MDFLPTVHLGESGVEHVPGEGGVKMAVRVAGGKGVRTPLIMLHGLQSHSGSQTFLAGLRVRMDESESSQWINKRVVAGRSAKQEEEPCH